MNTLCAGHCCTSLGPILYLGIKILHELLTPAVCVTLDEPSMVSSG